jgi:phosphomannomutase
MNQQVKTWIARDPDPKTRQELEQLLKDDSQDELKRRFNGRLAFGTAGLRAVLGAGPSRMNQLVVRETTAGLASYLLKSVPGCSERGVVVAYDGRHGSYTFAHDAASVLAAFGFKVHLSTQTLPTPVAAYAVRYFGAAAGIMVTASHNPPEYNGYKVYWGNGAQIIAPHDQGIAAEIDKAATQDIPYIPLTEGKEAGLIHHFGPLLLEQYLREIITANAWPGSPGISELKIVYTPLHGVGAEATERALKLAGFGNVYTVKEQREPDGDFPTVQFPNPEEDGAMDLALALAKEVKADLVFANDPDADRLAVALPNDDGGYTMLTGNEIGVVLGSDLINAVPKSNRSNSCVGTTIVSSRLLSKIAEAHGVGYFETLTGFKWIANKAITATTQGKNFLMGYEEALGYTVHNVVRDKDGVSAIVAFALQTARLREQDETILGLLKAIYKKYGLFLTEQKSLAIDPHAQGPSVGEKIRANMPKQIAGLNIQSIMDIQNGTRVDTATGKSETIDLPKSDVLSFILEDNSRVIVRPSGTEPKVKCYYEVIQSFEGGSAYEAVETQAQTRLADLIAKHQEELAKL